MKDRRVFKCHAGGYESNPCQHSSDDCHGLGCVVGLVALGIKTGGVKSIGLVGLNDAYYAEHCPDAGEKEADYGDSDSPWKPVSAHWMVAIPILIAVGTLIAKSIERVWALSEILLPILWILSKVRLLPILGVIPKVGLLLAILRILPEIRLLAILWILSEIGLSELEVPVLVGMGGGVKSFVEFTLCKGVCPICHSRMPYGRVGTHT